MLAAVAPPALLAVSLAGVNDVARTRCGVVVRLSRTLPACRARRRCEASTRMLQPRAPGPAGPRAAPPGPAAAASRA